jgi:prepilin-type N-terminal cleavage/methylation domain-containing protein
MRCYIRRGFSLIELAIVMIILAVIAAIFVPTATSAVDNLEDRRSRYTLVAVSHNAAALSANRGDEVYQEADFTTAVTEIGGTWSFSDQAGAHSSAYGEVHGAFAGAPSGTTVGLALRTERDTCAFALLQDRNGVPVTWASTSDIGAACNGTTALAGP